MARSKKDPAKHQPPNLPMVDADFNPMQHPVNEVALPDLSPDETGYEVAGFYAAVRFARGAGNESGHMFGVTCCAFARDKVGKPYLTSIGLPIEGVFTASCQKKDLLGNPEKVNDVRKAALDGAIRDMFAHIAENVAFENLKL
jgi:hypothetical protein